MSETGAYPPPHHMLGDLRLEILRDGDALSVAVPGVPELHGRSGVVGAAPLGVAVDVLGGNLALTEVTPDWCVTSTMELHLLRPLRGDFVVSGTPLRSGRTSVVLDVAVREVEGTATAGPAAVASMTFTRVERRPGTNPYRGDRDQPRFRFGTDGSQLSKPFLEQIGCRVIDASGGEVSLPVEGYVRNSIGTLQGGAVVSLIDAAAEAWASAHLGPETASLDLQVHFLSLGRVGPVRSRAHCLDAGASQARLRVELFDTGQDDRLISVGTVRLARFEGS